MTSINKWNKLKHSYLTWTNVKNKSGKMKRFFFYTASQRQELKRQLKKEIE